MKTLLAILLLLAAGPAFALTYTFGFVSASAGTGLGSTATINIKVPGTFGGANPTDATQGRYLKNAKIWVDSPASGDSLTTLQVIDIDGVVPVPARAAFASYPVIADMLDTVSGFTPALMLPSDGYVAEAFDQNGDAMTRFLPSGLYLKAGFQAGSGIGKTVRIVLRWGFWQ